MINENTLSIMKERLQRSARLIEFAGYTCIQFFCLFAFGFVPWLIIDLLNAVKRPFISALRGAFPIL